MHIHAYVALCLYAGLLAIVRVYLTWDLVLGWLLWNLILALIPYFFAMLAVKRWWLLFWIYFSLYLVFLPNSLYIFTDFIHLGRLPAYIHYDIVLISATALAGLISGFASIELMHTYWNHRYHRARAWILVSATMLIALLGVYIGRFLRWNSWDIVHDPLGLMREIGSLLISPNSLPAISDASRAWESLIFGMHAMNVYGFISLYFGFYMLLYIFLYHTRKVR